MNSPRLSRLPRSLLTLVFAFLASASSFAAAEDAAQRQLREDRERFQREMERQAAEAKIHEERARLAAEQQRTTDELERLRAQQSRQSSEMRSLTETTRTLATAPLVTPSPRVATQPSTTATPAAAITPDFSLTILPDGNCVLYLKGHPPAVKSPAEVQATLQQLLTPAKPAVPAL